MNEKFLQYCWRYKILKTNLFRDVTGNEVEIINFGVWNHDAGPDFLLAKIKINSVILVGHIELHLRSSDWEHHKHSQNKAYENVILHLVWQHDKTVVSLEHKSVPTIELIDYIDETLLLKYKHLESSKSKILCNGLVEKKHIPFGFFEEVLTKKLDEKSIEIEAALSTFKNDYEAVLFHKLAYAFGLKVNAHIFMQMLSQIDFGVIRKIQQDRNKLESLFFGQANWLADATDEQTRIWKTEYEFIKHKFQLQDSTYQPKFLRLRPPNFPTIRLSQLAHLYNRELRLFSKIINANTYQEIVLIFLGIGASEYWENRFNFGKINNKKTKKNLSEEFINLLIVNAVLPIKYTYFKQTKEGILDDIFNIYRQIPPEKNQILTNWKSVGINAENALESQALIYHQKSSCDRLNCLDCSIAYKIFKPDEI